MVIPSFTRILLTF